MTRDKLSLGIDTSNYKTSVAIVQSTGKILFNAQEFLSVKNGERGLRQSEALFQHVKQLPNIIKKALSHSEIRENIGCIGVSTKPRPIEGSYMPVFMAGASFAETLGAALNVPVYEFSHQEGHIEAIKFYSSSNTDPVICFHFSGGTTEGILTDKQNGIFKIIGGSKDLAYGQVLDRVGVTMGLDFPCGEKLDKIAVSASSNIDMLTKIKVKDGYVNLSGIETQAQRALNQYSHEDVVSDLFYKLSRSICDMTLQLCKEYGIKDFMYAGGVSGSRYIQSFLRGNLPEDFNLIFGDPKMSSDNAVGVALLGGENIWR